MRYDPHRPINTSPNNTGIEVLPQVAPAALWEHDGPDRDPIPDLKTCGFMPGPVYHYHLESVALDGFPRWFDNTWLFFGYLNGAWTAKIGHLSPGPFPRVTSVSEPPWVPATKGILSRGLQDMEYGPHDGALYIVDYGTVGYYDNKDANLYRVSYHGCINAVLDGMSQTSVSVP